jgi:hypothetical protein
MGADDIESRLRMLVLSDEERVLARHRVSEVFEVFGAMMQELLAYVNQQGERRFPAPP